MGLDTFAESYIALGFRLIKYNDGSNNQKKQ